MIAIRIRNLPADSSVHLALGGSGWKLEHYLLAHVFHSMAGIPHPALPTSEKSEDPIRVKRIEEFKERVRIRAEKIANNEIT